jgi:16S rRNA (cytosine967-C5)-methyltransferase
MTPAIPSTVSATPAMAAIPAIPLWRLLQAASTALMGVSQGHTLQKEKAQIPAPLRPGTMALTYHSLRWHGLTTHLIQTLTPKPPPRPVQSLLHVALSLLAPSPSQTEGVSYEAFTVVNQAVEAGARHPKMAPFKGLINACLRRFLREKEPLMAQISPHPEAIWNHPSWWIQAVQASHPTTWSNLLKANLAPAPLHIRVQTLRISRDALQALWEKEGIMSHPIGLSGLVLETAQDVSCLPGYAEGFFSVQDAGAQLAAEKLVGHLTDLSHLKALKDLMPLQEKGHRLRVLDACAAPGGKTAHLLDLLASSSLEGVKGEVLALEKDPERATRITENLDRLGLQAHIQVADASDLPSWWDGQFFEGVLLDAPCTASGIVRRHPDIPWLRRPSDIPALAQQQAALLNALWTVLRPGGYLLYCTCSVFEAEGPGQTQALMARFPDAQLCWANGLQPSWWPLSRSLDSSDNLLWDHDGFYYALWRKNPASSLFTI